MSSSRVPAIVFLCLTGSLFLLAGAAEWGYEGDLGPQHWGDLSPAYAACSEGTAQSPIDIRNTSGLVLPELEFDYHETPLAIFNNGHTIEVEYEEGSRISFLGREFEIVQFHFHTPSEHTFDGGASFEAEMHIVHRNDEGRLLVVGVLIRRGAANEALAPVWRYLPSVPDLVIHPEGTEVNLADVLPANKEYFAYAGSLTTPPCTEGVIWIVLKNPIELSREQIHKYQALTNVTCCERNRRPTQPLNGRTVFDGGSTVLFPFQGKAAEQLGLQGSRQ